MRRERGFSLVEAILALALLSLIGLAIASGVVSGQMASRTFESETLTHTRARLYQERLMALPFGEPGAGAASPAELNELFDDDDILGNATLHKLKNFGPVEFEPAGFPVPGPWRIAVDADLNGDGVLDPGADEGRNDLLRVAVLHDGRVRAAVVRFDENASP